jgi:Nidogen-like
MPLPGVLMVLALAVAATAVVGSPLRHLGGAEASTLGRNDDGSSGAVAPGFSMNFYGRTYTSLYVNNNGNISFEGPLREYVPFDLRSTRAPIVAAFFADVDTRNPNSGVVTYGVDSIDGRLVFGVNFFRVGAFDQRASPLNSFQLLLIERSDTGEGNFDIEFNYEQVGWDTSRDGRHPAAAVGFSNGSGSRLSSFELVGSRTAGAFLDAGPSSLANGRRNSDVRGRYVFQVRSGVVLDAELPARQSTASSSAGERSRTSSWPSIAAVLGGSVPLIVLLILAIAPTFAYPAISAVFVLWARLGASSRFGSARAYTSRLDAAVAWEAIPTAVPSARDSGTEQGYAYNEGESSSAFDRAKAWAAAIEEREATSNEPTYRALSRQAVLTTFGFMRVRGGIRLGIAHYLPPARAFVAVLLQALGRRRKECFVDGEWFPIVIRPWLLVTHGSRRTIFGNCWVSVAGRSGERRLGVLSARHALKPKNGRSGRNVSLDVSREPEEGRVILESRIMDAAVVEVSYEQWHASREVDNSSVIGYKPVQLLSKSGPRDGRVVELPFRTIPLAEPHEEPFAPTYQLVDVILDPGDSGCLVLDKERDDAFRPYLMYIGKIKRDSGWCGIGLLLEQPKMIWGLRFHAPED